MKLSDIPISNNKGFDYCCIRSGIRENKTINLMENTDLTKKNRTSKRKTKLFSYFKMGKETLTFGD